jgi:hypothetical protein
LASGAIGANHQASSTRAPALTMHLDSPTGSKDIVFLADRR